MSAPLQICDGAFDELIEVQSPVPSYPHVERQIPDRFTRVHERTYEIERASYVPTLADRYSFTNLLQRSDALNLAPWATSGVVSVTSDGAFAPTGESTAEVIADTSGASYGYIYQDVTVADDSATLTLSVFARRLSGVLGQIGIELTGGSGLSAFAQIDWLTGRITGLSGAVCEARPVNDGWVRYSISITNDASGNVTARVSLWPEISSGPAGQSAAAFWRAQLEYASTAGTPVSTAATSRTISVPLADTEDVFAFQVGEAKPSLVEGDVIRVMKTFATVPADQLSYGKRSFNRPNLHGLKVGSYYGVSFDDGATSWLFSTRKTISSIQALSDEVTAVTGSSSTTTSGYTFPSDVVNFTIAGGGSGTFLLTDSVVTIQAALSGAGGNAYSIAAGSRTMYFNPTILSSTGNIQSLSTTSAGVSISPTGTAAWQIIGPTSGGSTVSTVNNTETTANLPSLRRILTSAAHSGAVGDHVVFWKSGKIVAMSKAYAVPSSAAVDVLLDDVPGKDFTADYCAFSSGAAVRYVNGERDCTVRITEKFYLPGYTAGIATGADVPQVTVYADPIGWLTAIDAGGDYHAIAAPVLETWMGPILVQRTEEIQMADALESRDVNA